MCIRDSIYPHNEGRELTRAVAQHTAAPELPFTIASFFSRHARFFACSHASVERQDARLLEPGSASSFEVLKAGGGRRGVLWRLWESAPATKEEVAVSKNSSPFSAGTGGECARASEGREKKEGREAWERKGRGEEEERGEGAEDWRKITNRRQRISFCF